MRRSFLALPVLAVALAGCATTGITASSDPFSLLNLALDSSPDALKQDSAKDNRQAEYALAIVYTYGLNGMPKDAAQVADLRTRANRAVNTPITQYIAGLDGKPGRTAIINMSGPGVNPIMARAADDCAAALDSGATDTAACGDATSRDALMTKWRKAAGR